MSAHWWNTLGLVANVIGAAIVFRYGLPQPDFKEGTYLVVGSATVLPDGRTGAEHDADTRAKRDRHALVSKVGMSVLILGFVLELVGTWS